MAKRVYLAESDGKSFPTKKEAEDHDDEVYAERKAAVFQERFAIFLSETDYELPTDEAGIKAFEELLNAIRDNSLSFMEVMEVALPKQWKRKLRAKRGETSAAPKKKTAKKKSTSKKTGKAKKPSSKKAAPVKEPAVEFTEDQKAEQIGPNRGAVDPEETPPAAFEEVTEVPDPPEEPADVPPPPPEDEVPPPPEASVDETPPPPPEDDGLTPPPDFAPEPEESEEGWRGGEDESPIPSVD